MLTDSVLQALACVELATLPQHERAFACAALFSASHLSRRLVRRFRTRMETTFTDQRDAVRAYAEAVLVTSPALDLFACEPTPPPNLSNSFLFIVGVVLFENNGDIRATYNMFKGDIGVDDLNREELHTRYKDYQTQAIQSALTSMRLHPEKVKPREDAGFRSIDSSFCAALPQGLKNQEPDEGLEAALQLRMAQLRLSEGMSAEARMYQDRSGTTDPACSADMLKLDLLSFAAGSLSSASELRTTFALRRDGVEFPAAKLEEPPEDVDVEGGFSSKAPITLVLDPKIKMLSILFSKDNTQYEAETSVTNIVNFALLPERGLLFTLQHPPLLLLKDRFESSLSKKGDVWVRTTDYICAKGGLAHSLTYFLTTRMERSELASRLDELGMPYGELAATVAVRHVSPSWWLDAYEAFCKSLAAKLLFQVRYELEVLLHSGIVSPDDLTPGFADLLCNVAPARAASILRQMRISLSQGAHEKSITDEFEYWTELMSSDSVVLHSQPDEMNYRINRATITPLRTVPMPSERECGNRILRWGGGVTADRLMRVTFAEEDLGILPGAVVRKGRSIKKRIHDVLHLGVTVGGRRFVFLGCSSSGLKNASCWFFHECASLTAEKFRQQTGEYGLLSCPAKFVARFGMCFSATHVGLGIPLEQGTWQTIPDIVRLGNCFTDGCGLISSELLQDVVCHMGYTQVPSALQIRLGGAKGMVVWDPSLPGRLLCTRPSMEKFASASRSLEICEAAHFKPCYLNRDLILLLTSRGVDQQSLWCLVAQQLSEVQTFMIEPSKAIDILERMNPSADSFTGTALKMLQSGVQPSGDAFLQSVLRAVVVFQMETLRTKAKIHVADGANLKGVVDTIGDYAGGPGSGGVLKHGQVFLQVRIPGEPQPTVITGRVIVVKHPCHHPGDVLVLNAVNCDELHHLFDVLVFPQRGDRPHADETSGGDLDGDEFTVIWDQTLLPPMAVEPMRYSTKLCRKFSNPSIWWIHIPKQLPFSVSRACFFWPKQCVRAVSAGAAGPCVVHRPARLRCCDDERGAQMVEKAMGASAVASETASDSNANARMRGVHRFFIDYIESNNLGFICNEWLVRTDLLGAMDPGCLQLARLASQAVDFQKTGLSVNMPRNLTRSKRRPSFMQPKFGVPTYESTSFLGQLFRYFTNQNQFAYQSAFLQFEAIPVVYDSRLEVEGFELFLSEARLLRQEYHLQLSEYMHQYAISDEAMLLTGNIAKLEQGSSSTAAGRRESFERADRIKESVHALRRVTRGRFQALVTEAQTRLHSHNEPRQASRVPLQLASAMYVVTYNGSGGPLSFPWTVSEHLLLALSESTGGRGDNASEPRPLPASVAEAMAPSLDRKIRLPSCQDATHTAIKQTAAGLAASVSGSGNDVAIEDVFDRAEEDAKDEEQDNNTFTVGAEVSSSPEITATLIQYCSFLTNVMPLQVLVRQQADEHDPDGGTWSRAVLLRHDGRDCYGVVYNYGEPNLEEHETVARSRLKRIPSEADARDGMEEEEDSAPPFEDEPTCVPFNRENVDAMVEEGSEPALSEPALSEHELSERELSERELSERELSEREFSSILRENLELRPPLEDPKDFRDMEKDVRVPGGSGSNWNRLHMIAAHPSRGTKQQLSQYIAAHPDYVTQLNKDLELPLHLAVRERKADLASILIDHHRDGVLAADRFGEVPLHAAARNGDVTLVKMLLEAEPKAALCENCRQKRPDRVALIDCKDRKARDACITEIRAAQNAARATINGGRSNADAIGNHGNKWLHDKYEKLMQAEESDTPTQTPFVNELGWKLCGINVCILEENHEHECICPEFGRRRTRDGRQSSRPKALAELSTMVAGKRPRATSSSLQEGSMNDEQVASKKHSTL